MMKVGYSFWGFLGDTKYSLNGQKLSTPDGNAFYSWCIIKEFQRRGYDVITVMPDRDFPSVACGKDLFKEFAANDRKEAYMHTYSPYENNMRDSLGVDFWLNNSYEDIRSLWDEAGMNECRFILHEWRMSIYGRNIGTGMSQPDYIIQECLIRYCKEKDIELIVFDLDYKLTDYDIERLSQQKAHIIELGMKHIKNGVKNAKHVYIPFDFSHIQDFKIMPLPCYNLVYVGNRYERDWAVTKYIPSELKKVAVFGNWNEGGRDSSSQWPYINFRNRIQPGRIHAVYNDAIATILLAKKEYTHHGFMTARLIEAVYYGCVPLFIDEFDKSVILEYAGMYADTVCVKDKCNVIEKIMLLKYDLTLRKHIIEYMRDGLKFMDVKYFVNELEGISDGTIQ